MAAESIWVDQVEDGLFQIAAKKAAENSAHLQREAAFVDMGDGICMLHDCEGACNQPIRPVTKPSNGTQNPEYIKKKFSDLMQGDNAYCDCPPRPRDGKKGRSNSHQQQKKPSKGLLLKYNGEAWEDAKLYNDRTQKLVRSKRLKRTAYGESNRLSFFQCQASDGGDWHKFLHGKEEVMKFVTSEKTKTEPECMERAKYWEDKWDEGNPFSVFTVKEKASGEFVGIVQIDEAHEIEKNSAEISGLLRQDRWGPKYKYGREAMDCIMSYAQGLVDKQTKLPSSGVDFNCIIATAHPDNTKSVWLLRGYRNFPEIKERGESYLETYGNERRFFKKVLSADPDCA